MQAHGYTRMPGTLAFKFKKNNNIFMETCYNFFACCTFVQNLLLKVTLSYFKNLLLKVTSDAIACHQYDVISMTEG